MRDMALLTAAVSLYLLAGCNGQMKGDQEQSASPAQMTPATIALINDNPGEYVGRIVTVTGTVKYHRAPGVIGLGQPDQLGSEILVIHSKRAPFVANVQSGDFVQVTGIVKTFLPELVTGAGPSFATTGPDVDPEFVRLWKDRPVIVAPNLSKLEYPLAR